MGYRVASRSSYTLAAQTLGDLIQADVAITFINELVDMAVAMSGTPCLLRLPSQSTCARVKKPVLGHYATSSSIFVIIPVSLGITYGLHNSYC